MAITKSLQNFVDEIRASMDMEADQNITDAQFYARINAALRTVWSVAGRICRDEYTGTFTFTVPSTPPVYTIVQADFLELRAVDIDPGGGNYIRIKPWAFAAMGRIGRVSYRATGKTLYFMPEQGSLVQSFTYRAWYIKAPTTLVNPSDTIDLPLAGDEWVVAQVTAWFKGTKREEDPAPVLAMRADAERRMKNWLMDHNRQPEPPADISDDWNPQTW